MVHWGYMKTIPPDTKQCETCKEHFNKKVTTSRKNWKKSRFCSRKCKNDSLKGKPFFDSTGIAPWNKGKTGYMSEQGRKNIGESTKRSLSKWTPEQRKERHAKTVATRKRLGSYTGQLGKTKELSSQWKGNKASYNAKHRWIQKHWTKTGTCERCGLSPKPYGNRRWGTEWHNIDEEYNREDRSRWMEVCKSCHHILDYEIRYRKRRRRKTIKKVTRK